jgi:hypothetical protein
MIYSTIYYAWRNAIQRTWPKLAYLFLRFLSFSLSLSLSLSRPSAIFCEINLTSDRIPVNLASSERLENSDGARLVALDRPEERFTEAVY